MHQSIPAAPSPPRANPREFAFFFLWIANSRGREHLSCLMPGGGDESRGQMPGPLDRSNQVFIHYIIDYCRFQRYSLFPRSFAAFCTFFSIRFPHHGTGYQPFKASFHFCTSAVDRCYSRTSQTNTIFFIIIFKFLVFIML